MPLRRNQPTLSALIVHAHPNPDSLSAQLRDAAIAGLSASGYSVEQINLYDEEFRAAMSRQERLDYPDSGAPSDPEAIRHASLLKTADTLVFVFPTWWFGVPAILKGWFERVFVPGVAFHLSPKNNKVKSDLRHVTRLIAITTTGADKTYIAAVGNGARWMITRTLRLMCAPTCRTTWLSLDKIEGRTDDERQAFIQKVEQKLSPS
ncbi:MAG: NAD(P)H-dependent oxidoreductase [Acidimicrobiales bacterium]